LLKYKEIFLGGRCNNNCLHCPAGHKSSPQLDSAHIIPLLTEKDRDSVALYGGEPTVRSDLLEIIRAAGGNKYRRIKLLTNGRALSDFQFLEQVVNAGCYLFEIKLWGSNPSLHDHLTRVSGSFLETIRGLENLGGLAENKFVCIRIPVCKENYQDVENTVATSLNFGVNRIILSIQDHKLSFQSILPHIKNAINISIFNRIWILTEGMPFCVMSGLEQHMGEIYYGWETYYDRVFKQHGYCVDCIYKELCPGVDAGYLNHSGNKEFTPVTAGTHFRDIKALYE
jgi:sulfatase maturation enzyme AslB (radical SAM superfamily)